MSARLFAIIDGWESMTHVRVYKPAREESVVIGHIRDNAGKHFNPELVHFFVANYREITPLAATGSQRRVSAPGFSRTETAVPATQ